MVKDYNASWVDGGSDASRPRSAIAFFTNDAIEIVVTRLDVAPKAVRDADALLSDAERQRASRFVFDHDRRRFVVARAHLRRLLSERLGVRPESVELVYGAHGKPALARRYAEFDLRFNVSHSNDVAAYAFSQGRDIGIDIESFRAIAESDNIAALFFSRRENEAYRALHPRDRPLGFFNCWTRKEAFIKALGAGLHHPLDRFDVTLAPSEPAKILCVDSTPGDVCGWALHSFVPGPGLIGAVVVQKHVQESVTQHTNESQCDRSPIVAGTTNDIAITEPQMS